MSWSVLGHSVSTWAASAVRGPETAPDVVLPLFALPSSAPEVDKRERLSGKKVAGWPGLRTPIPGTALPVVYLQLFCQPLLLLFQLVYCFLIPASGLGLQVTGPARDHPWLLEQGPIQCHCLKTGGGRNWTKESPILSLSSYNVAKESILCGAGGLQRLCGGHPPHCHRQGHCHKHTAGPFWCEVAHSESHQSPALPPSAPGVSHL